MSDPMDRLKSAMAQATPSADPATKAETLALARKSFDAAQGMADGARPNSARSHTASLAERIRTMIAHFGRPGLYGAFGATTALVAVGLFLTLPDLQHAMTPPTGDIVTVSEQATAPAPAQRSVPSADMALDDQPIAKPAPHSFGFANSGNMPAAGGVQGATQLPSYERIDSPDAVSGTEDFANAEPSALHVTAEDPVSTFAVDVDTAAWSLIRAMLNFGQLPPADAVRIEEMVNYFPYDYAAPRPQDPPFRPTVATMQTPWNDGTQLLRVGLQGAMPAVADRPPLNLVFLVDTSGSMQSANKLPLLVQSLKMMLSELRPEDEVAIVTYAGTAGVALEPVRASERSRIETALDALTAGGSTAGQAGLEGAYALAEDMTDDGEVSRVLLATDGDFNVGLSDPDLLKSYIADKRDSGTYLSVLGFGRGNLDDALMQALAQNGNGNAAYIDTLAEARKVLVDQLTGALFPLADDVKVQVEFNPATVAEYRLIGYETRALRREDFANDRVDAGEIGAGHQVTALYEITPVGSDAALTEPLRYGAGTPPAGPEDELGLLRLRWKAPGEGSSQLIEQVIGTEVTSGDDDMRFAAAIAGFGQVLRDGAYIGDWSFGDAILLAEGAQGEDRFGYRREAVSLMRIAEALAR